MVIFQRFVGICYLHFQGTRVSRAQQSGFGCPN